MHTQAFLSDASQPSETVEVELSLKLHSYPRADREPVKLLIIGSKTGVNTLVHALHQHRFAEIFEWTDFLPAPDASSPLRFHPGEVMKALVKYLPRL